MENKTDSNEEIYELIMWERQCRVTQRLDELAACYYPDATIITSWTNGSVSVEKYVYGGKAPLHDPEFPIVSRIGYPVIHRNGRRAYAEVPSMTIRWVLINGEKAVLEYYMRLIYRMEQRANAWKISDFRSIYESDALRPEIPGADLHIDPIELAGLRHSYRYLAYVDKDVSQDLPGIDRQEDVEKLYTMLESWLTEDGKNKKLEKFQKEGRITEWET